MPPDSAHSSAFSATAAARIAELEHALQEATSRAAAAERHLGGLLEQTGPGLLLLAPDGTIRRVNKALCQLLGLTEPLGHWEGQPADVLFARLQHLAAQPARHARQLVALRAAQQPALGEVLRLRDGRVLTQDYALLPGQSEGGRNELFSYRLASQLPKAELATEIQHNEVLHYLP
ncbi:MAG TPA: PAS domain-containing protein, partial [Hymenobacter sp.]